MNKLSLKYLLMFISCLFFTYSCVYSQLREVYVNTSSELYPFIGIWKTEKNNKKIILILSSKKILSGTNILIGKYKLVGEFYIFNEYNNLIYDSSTEIPLEDKVNTIGAISIEKDFFTKSLDIINNLNNSFFVSFLDEKNCMTKIYVKMTIDRNINQLIWKSEIAIPDTMDAEGIHFSDKTDQEISIEENGCMKIVDKSKMSIPADLIFTRVN